MNHDNTIDIPGYNNLVEYRLTQKDYNFIAQHNYSAQGINTDIVMRGWYDKAMVKDLVSVIGLWHVKSVI